VSAPSVYGEIPGYPPGSTFSSRDDVRQAGLHRHNQRGISGNFDEGADAIVVNGGYVDDEDYGDRIVYTGEGGQSNGKQVAAQALVLGNAALAHSGDHGLPVRVIRGYEGDPQYSPKSGYRYDGLFAVTDRWSEPSIHGPLIYRFELVRQDGDDTWQGQSQSSEAPAGTAEPPRTVGTVQRVVRNTRVSQWVKELYDYTCQICGIRLEVDGVGYAEGAHIRALGTPHNGPDRAENILCLCPNDHVLFDRGALYVLDGYVYDARTRLQLKPLGNRAPHLPKPEHLAYHRQRFAGIEDGTQ
jgi:putative restriction endonuclease